MLLRSRPYSGRAGTVACVQNRSDECLGKPSVRPKQEAKVDRGPESKVLPKRESGVVPTWKPVANARSPVVVLEVDP